MTLHPSPTAWRSLLYVPAHNQKFIEGASKRGADAIVLDLEDGVPPQCKEEARNSLRDAVRRVSPGSKDVFVRINRLWGLAWRDLEVAAATPIAGILLPKVEQAAHITVIADYLSELEVASGRDKPIRLIPLIESARGIRSIDKILTASPRVCAVIPGNEDLANDLQVSPDPEIMLHTHMPIILAARAAGITLLGVIGSSANFRDLGGYKQRVQLTKTWGFEGATCIHPTQVPILNEVFAPSDMDIARARAIVTAFNAAGGNPVSLAGTMIDLPIFERARRLLRTAGEQ
jgi:citrate lyase subunit beta/citryl-CoA lyase